jgi:hypothetical protein
MAPTPVADLAVRRRVSAADRRDRRIRRTAAGLGINPLLNLVYTYYGSIMIIDY